MQNKLEIMDNLLNEISILLEKFEKLQLKETIDYEKYNYYSIVHHSTSIEGSTLTEEETQLLLDEKMTAKGKPIEHHNMQIDHYDALLFTVQCANEKRNVTPELIKNIAGKVMRNTGGVNNTILGSYDSSKGDFRLQNVHTGETRFVDFSKVPHLMDVFCKELNEALINDKSNNEALITAFDAHFNLVSIHPFVDGNGRTSRLLMNYVQQYHSLPLSNVFKEDKADYYKALVQTRAKEDPNIFRTFMLSQYKKMLEKEINKDIESKKEHIIKKDKKRGFGLSIIF